MLHLQIGPSQLALGLLVPSTLAAGFDVCIVGRPGDKSPREYGVAGSGPTGRLGYFTVNWFEGPERLGDLPADLTSRIESGEPMLVTCTLRGRIDERRPFIEELLHARPAGSETILLACENAPGQAYAELVDNCKALDVTFLHTVVNRMCIGRDRDRKGRRIVSAHELGEWLIEQLANPSELLDALVMVDEVRLVVDIEAYHDRKLWMVNGAHQALALMARDGKTPDLRIARDEEEPCSDPDDDLRPIAQDPRVIGRLSHLHGAMDDALQQVHPALSGNLDYGLEHVRAYGEHPDSISRVLGAFLRRDLAPFIETLDVRLAQPARICFEQGRSVAPFAHVFDLFEIVVENLDAFSDAAEIREDPDSFDPAADERAIEAYACLVSGWNSDQQAEERIVRFVESLAVSCP